MQNDFEKQVRQKMEELDLVPSPPVWEKIESKIQDKKDRRRYALWFFLLCVLLGGGITWLSVNSEEVNTISKSESQYEINDNKSSDTVSLNPENSPSIQNQPITEKENSTIKEKLTDTETEEIENNTLSKQIVVNKKPQAENNTVVTTSVNKDRKINNATNQKFIDSDIPSKSVSITNKKTKSANTQRNKTVITPAVDKVFSTESKIPVDTKPVKQANPSQQKNNEPAKNTPDTADAKKAVTVNAVVSTDPVIKTEVTAENPFPAVDSVSKATDVVLAKSTTKSSKWQFGFAAEIGVSGLGEGINFSQTSNDKSLFDAFPQSSPSSSSARIPYSRGYTPPSVVKKNIAYSVSAVVKRLIGKKTQISSGIGYNQYSTLLESGRMDSVNIRFGNSAGGSQSFTAGSTFSNYSNKFHFITVPLNVHFRLFKKTPLNLYGGLAVKYMVATNSMEYNHLTYLYSSDINAYNRTQFFSNFGFEYAVLNKKNQLMVGPELTYGISTHLNTGSPQHLYSIGIKAEYLFQKK